MYYLIVLYSLWLLQRIVGNVMSSAVQNSQKTTSIFKYKCFFLLCKSCNLWNVCKLYYNNALQHLSTFFVLDRYRAYRRALVMFYSNGWKSFLLVGACNIYYSPQHNAVQCFGEIISQAHNLSPFSPPSTSPLSPLSPFSPLYLTSPPCPHWTGTLKPPHTRRHNKSNTSHFYAAMETFALPFALCTSSFFIYIVVTTI